MNLISIHDLTVSRVQDELRSALRHGADHRALRRFAAAIDWSEDNPIDSAVAEMIGLVDLWTTEFTDGDLLPREYVPRLLSLLSPASPS